MLDDTTELHSQFRICIQAGRMATNKMMIMMMMLTVMVMMMMVMVMMMVMRIASVTCLSTSATPYFPCCTTLDIIADHYHDNEADGEGVIGGFLSSYKLLGFHQQNLLCPASLQQSKRMFVSQIPGMIHLDTCQDS